MLLAPSSFIRVVLACVGVAFCAMSSVFAQDDDSDTSVLASRIDQSVLSPSAQEYLQELRAKLSSDSPVITLPGLQGKAKVAQDTALSTQGFVEYAYHPDSRQPIRNEIMIVRKSLPGDHVGKAATCADKDCYRVELYNFFFNVATTAIVDVAAKQTVSITHNRHTQPDLSPRLRKLANDIANESRLVQEALGEKLGEIDPVMAEIKTALKNSRCERSRHLCVAPTYLVGDRALWAIVDLTDLRVVGVRWTDLGDSGPPIVVTERTLSNEFVYFNYCVKTHELEQNGWRLNYHLTSSDGLRIADVTFNDQHVLRSAKLVDWHVSYSQREGFGYSDATGCPIFSNAVVVAYNAPWIEPITVDGETVGFELIQDFRQQPWPAPCNYRYEQRYQFYNDGRFRTVMGDLGRGCGTDGTYRPVMRIDFGKSASGADYEIAHWSGDNWNVWQNEQWSSQIEQSSYFDGVFSHRMRAPGGEGYLIEPGNGQFDDGGRGDFAYTYFTVAHPDLDEGDQDLVTLGSCCNTSHEQGPELFMQPPEPLSGNLVMWYVPQLKNDGRPGSKYCWADTEVKDGSQDIKIWPCYAGPQFVPLGLRQSD